MRVFLILLGLLLMIGGAAVAGAQYAPPDLLKMLDSAPAQARDFLQTQAALYAGGGAAGFGFLLVILAAATGGKKKAPKAMPVTGNPVKAKAKATEPKPEPAPAPKPAPPSPPVSAAPVAAPVTPVAQAAAPPPAAPPPAEPARPEPPKAKPQASAQPPASAAGEKMTIAEAARVSPLLHNRRRVSDLVTINDALKAYFKKHGAYPAAEGLGGMAERGAAWIPGLAPDFLPELPRDPAATAEGGGPQYVYASDGKDYKLLAHNVSLVGSTSVEVLGVKVDRTRQPTMENASFGYWTPGFTEI